MNLIKKPYPNQSLREKIDTQLDNLKYNENLSLGGIKTIKIIKDLLDQIPKQETK